MKKVLLTAALLAAPTVGFSKGVIQLDVSGFSYGSSAQTFDTDDVTAATSPLTKETTTKYGTTDAKIKVGAIDEKMFFRFTLDIPGGGTASSKFIEGGYAVIPSNLYITLGLGSKNAAVKTEVEVFGLGDQEATTWVYKQTDFQIGARYMRDLGMGFLDSEFNINYGVVGSFVDAKMKLQQLLSVLIS